MNVRELIEHLSTLPAEANVVIEDLNGLYWKMEPSLAWEDAEGNVVLSKKEINHTY